ncbi:MAG TPA: SDR family NAD(P)-dependent oxidoreductase, partial [Actinomycetospora sp.]|nr:SDR family NAD(P)-dependent oxidoreductase [Actinomycetospora sp.]
MNPVVLVTGGSRGIGAAVVTRVAAAGWSVCLTYRGDSAAADDALARAHAAGVDARAVRADVAVEADVEAAFAAAHTMGPLAGVVANAGVVVPKARVDAMTAQRVADVLAVNVV